MGCVIQVSEASRRFYFGIGDDPEADPRGGPARVPMPGEREELPYRVEVWDQTGTSVEQILAVTASGSIGYAAYYAATREFPHRYITLRHRNSVLSRWTPAGN